MKREGSRKEEEEDKNCGLMDEPSCVLFVFDIIFILGEGKRVSFLSF